MNDAEQLRAERRTSNRHWPSEHVASANGRRLTAYAAANAQAMLADGGPVGRLINFHRYCQHGEIGLARPALCGETTPNRSHSGWQCPLASLLAWSMSSETGSSARTGNLGQSGQSCDRHMASSRYMIIPALLKQDDRSLWPVS
jgi:hypothetical protein